MPADTVYITQIRQPIKQLTSFLNYNNINGFEHGSHEPVDIYQQLGM